MQVFRNISLKLQKWNKREVVYLLTAELKNVCKANNNLCYCNHIVLIEVNKVSHLKENLKN